MAKKPKRSKGRYKHKQVRAMQPDGSTIWVDEGMKELLEALWRMGIDTVLSCQENFPGIAWVEFTTPGDAMRFLEVAWELADDEMRYRMEGEWDVPGSWECNAHQWHLGDGWFTLNIDIRMPVEDKDQLADLLAEALSHKQAEDFLARLEQAGLRENAA